MTTFPDSTLWEFSISVYIRSGVPDACIELQDRHGLDVNVLFFHVWDAVRRAVPLTAAQIAEVEAAVADWQGDIVAPLREVRRRLKSALGPGRGPIQALREQVKAVELDAERLEQLMLAALDLGPLDRGPTQPDAIVASAVANVQAYLDHLGVACDAKDRDCLYTILVNSLPVASPASILKALDDTTDQADAPHD